MADYTTVQIVRDTIGSKEAGNDDTVIERLITAVSRQIDRACNRPDGFVAGSVATERLYAGDGGSVLRIDECAAITQVAVKGSASSTAFTLWDADDWLPFSGDPLLPDFNRMPYTAIMVSGVGSGDVFTDGSRSARSAGGLSGGSAGMMRLPTVKITAKWGYALNAPEDIANAAVIQIARMFSRGKSAFADTLASLDFGTLQYRRLDPEVESILRDGRYIRQSI